MTDINALVDKLIAAKAPSGLLDEEIAGVVGWDPDVAIPRWTASVEAAIALVPGDPTYSIFWQSPLAACSVGDSGPSLAATPALAMCMAALRARAKMAAEAAPRPASDQG